MKISVPFITDNLRKDILFAIKQKPDYIALSFVTCAKDINDARALFEVKGANIPVISKIERGEAVNNFNSILDASDGHYDCPGRPGGGNTAGKSADGAKELIKKCNRAGKPVITATEMLESMVDKPAPYPCRGYRRRQCHFDGTDAIMLSEETSIGKYPVQAVQMMSNIAQEAERVCRMNYC